MPITTVTDGVTALSASYFNANVRDQVISTTTSAARPSGTEGQVIYETDTDKFFAYTGSAWVEYGKVSAFNSYTPTLTQSATITKTVNRAVYFKIGRFVWFTAQLTCTSSGTANNIVTISLPVTAASSSGHMGTGQVNDQSAVTEYPGLLVGASTTTCCFLDATAGTQGVRLGQTGAAFSAALVSTDTITLTGSYEAAS